MNKLFKWLGVLLVLALLMSACQPATSSKPGEPGEPIKVAVVMPCLIDDHAFCQSMYDSLNKMKSEMGADQFDFVFSDGMFDIDSAATAIRDYVSEGYNLVIAHSTMYGSTLKNIAPDFPETAFAWGISGDTFSEQGISNVFAYEARSEEGGYVNGVIAASLSQSDVLGVIGPFEKDDAKLYVDGFVAGAKATTPEIEVRVKYIDSFNDVGLASSAANIHIQYGADGLTGLSEMVVGAINIAKRENAYWFGAYSNQTSLAPSIVVANMIYDWTAVLKPMIEKIRSGQLGGEAFALTLANGGLVIEFNPEMDISAEVKDLADSTIAGISSGSIQVGED